MCKFDKDRNVPKFDMIINILEVFGCAAVMALSLSPTAAWHHGVITQTAVLLLWLAIVSTSASYKGLIEVTQNNLYVTICDKFV